MASECAMWNPAVVSKERVAVDLCSKAVFMEMMERDMKSLLASWNRTRGKELMWVLWSTNKKSWDQSFVRALLRFLDMMGCEDLMVEVCTDVLEECERSMRERMVYWLSRKSGHKLERSVSERMRRLETDKDKFRIEILHRLSQLEVKRGNHKAAQTAFKRLHKLLGCLKDVSFKERDQALVGLVEMSMFLKEWDRAKEYLKELVALRMENLGEEHRDTICSMNKMSLVFSHACEYEDAEKWLKRVVEMKQKTLDWGHHSILSSMENLAMIWLLLKRVEEAEEMYRTVREIQLLVLGADHPNTLATGKKLKEIWTLNPWMIGS